MPPTFHVFISGETKGPYLLDQLRSMWDHGVLTADTLYWHEKKQEWHHLAEMLRGTKMEEAFTPPPAEPTDAETPKENLAPANHRLMARFIDLQIFGFLGYFLAEGIVKAFSLDVATFYFPLAFTLAVTTESLWLALFRRTTPGKWFFGLHIEGDGSYLVRRTWAVYWRCAPIFAPFTTVLAFRDIARTGSTKWDKKTNSRVCTGQVEGIRIGCGVLLVAIAVVATILVLLGYLGSFSSR